MGVAQGHHAGAPPTGRAAVMAILVCCRTGPSCCLARTSFIRTINSTPAPSRYTMFSTTPFICASSVPQVSWVVPELLLTAAHSAVLLGSLHALRLPLATRNSSALIFLLLWTW